jgi:MOSC domain-containing protein YiiM
MNRGSIVAVCRSNRKGVPKRSIEEGRLVRDHGLDQDAHAGDWHRQVSVLDIGDIREMKAKGLKLSPGAFGENLIIADINTSELGLGSRLKLGEAEIEITQIGKVCHDRCAIYYSAGDCIMPRLGLFAEVRVDGAVRVGDSVEVVHQVPRDHIQVAVLAGVGGVGDDIVERLEAEGAVHLAWSGPAPDGKNSRETIRELCGRGLDLLVVVSGDRQGFSRAVDSGTEAAAPTGLQGRVSKTVVALVDDGTSDFPDDAFVPDLLEALCSDSTPATSSLPTVSTGLVGA